MRTTLAILAAFVMIAAAPFDTPPQAITPHTVTAADYPPRAVSLGVQGTAKVDFLVQTDGSVGDIRIAESTGNADLDQAAAMIVGRWRFTPAMLGGRPVPARLLRNVKFVLAPPAPAMPTSPK